jgi:hypothetical protein
MQLFLNLWLSLLERSVIVDLIFSQQFYTGLLRFPVWCQNIVSCQQPFWIQCGSQVIHPIVWHLIINLTGNCALDTVFWFSITYDSLVLSGNSIVTPFHSLMFLWQILHIDGFVG